MRSSAKHLLFTTLWLLFIVSGYAQIKDYSSEMLRLHSSIQQHFYLPEGYYKETVQPEKDSRAVSYLWPLCALIQADNEMEKVAGGQDFLNADFKIIQKYHNHLPPAPGYASYTMEQGGGDRFYDDNQWIGIAAMDAHERTKNGKWLAVGKEIYQFMMTAYDTAAGGGLYWQEGKKTTKNTCSNGPGIILALQLYKATKEKSYLDTALLLYKWVNAHLRSPSGLYYDNIKIGSNQTDKRQYSYNTGTMLQSAVYLFECTNDQKYLQEAIAIADSATDFFLADKKFKDDYWFSAVLLRGYQHLLKHNPDKKHIMAFGACLDNALTQNKNAMGLMGKEHTINLVGQGGMLEILARFAWMQKQGIVK